MAIDVPVKHFIGNPTEYEEMNNVFSKNEKADQILNELDKVPSTSKNDNLLNHELKMSPVSNGHDTIF